MIKKKWAGEMTATKKIVKFNEINKQKQAPIYVKF